MWAVVPLKSPAHAKTRLAAVLTPLQRRQLLFELGERVIAAARRTAGIDAVAVVTADAEVAAFADRLGAVPLMQSREDGCTAAFVAALPELQRLRPRGLLMLAGDLPLVSPAALQRLLQAGASGATVVIAPDRRRRCINALLCEPADAIAPCFGSDSLRRSIAAAAAAGVRSTVVDDEALALDLDIPDDLDCLHRHPGAGLHTLPDRGRLAGHGADHGAGHNGGRDAAIAEPLRSA
jgi:2-phospho-L-lactate guanylyltransferase